MPQTSPRTKQNRPALALAPRRDGHVAATVDRHGADQPGYEWVALSVTTVGALLASLQGSSLVIALPDVLTGLNSTFLTIMWVLLGYLLITTALVPVVGRLADMVGRKNLYVAGFAVFTLASLLAGFSMLPMEVVSALFVVAAVGLVGFVLAEVRSREPMLDLRLFADRLFGFA